MPDLDSLIATIQDLYRVLGQNTCECLGCRAEIDAALKAIRESGVALSETDERRKGEVEAIARGNTEVSACYRKWLSTNPRLI